MGSSLRPRRVPCRLRVSDASLHPNPAGHRAYATILERFVADVTDRAVAAGHDLNRAGLPTAALSPSPPPGSNPRGDTAGASTSGSAAKGASADGAADRRRQESSVAESPEPSGPSVGTLVHRRPVPVVAVCGALLSPGEAVLLTAGGFAADSSVSFTVVGATVLDLGASPPIRFIEGLSIPAATADGDGDLSVSWTVPAAPDAATDAVPRWYIVKATGTGSGGGAHAAYPARPITVYPGTEPCAVADAATTTLGSPMRVAVLANDVAPTGGSLDAASVYVTPAAGGSFSVDAADGSVTFVPDAGFAGAVSTHYWVYDNWGFGVRATLTVTVDAGCTITGNPGAVHIVGTAGDDVICVGAPEDPSAFHVIDAGAGDDLIVAGAGVDWIDGGVGSDVIYARGGADRIVGGAGTDTIHGGDDFDTIHTTDLADTIIDDADGYEVILVPVPPAAHTAPVAGDDAAHVTAGGAVTIGVLDNDFDADGNLVAASLSIVTAPTLGAVQATGTSPEEVAVLYTAGNEAGVDSFAYEVCDTLGACATGEVSVTVGAAGCTIVGTDGDDTLVGTAGADVICGLGGNDVISGLGGDDVLVGGGGDDRLYGGGESYVGDDGDDTLFGGAGGDTLVGGNGTDTVWGGAGDDTLAGNSQNDSLHGGPGADVLDGGGGDDVLWGGAGDDILTSHAGDDVLHGGPGDDTLTGANGDDVLFGGAGGDTLTGAAGDDVLWGGPGDDTLYGNSQDDTLLGGAGIDVLRGGGGDDRLTGGTGDDQLDGNAGDDRLWGGVGGDDLDGGRGADYVDGGVGADTCGRGEMVARCES